MEFINQFKEFLSSEEGKECYTKLLSHSKYLLDRYQFASGKNLELDPEDIVSEAICKVLEDKRHWDAESVSTEAALKKIIQSVIDHSFDTVKSLLTSRFLQDHDREVFVPLPAESEINSYAEGTRVLTPEELFFSENDSKDFKVNLLKVLEGHPELEDIALCVLEGISKTQRIAEELGITVTEVNNRKKRLKRKEKEIRHKPQK